MSLFFLGILIFWLLPLIIAAIALSRTATLRIELDGLRAFITAQTPPAQTSTEPLPGLEAEAEPHTPVRHSAGPTCIPPVPRPKDEEPEPGPVLADPPPTPSRLMALWSNLESELASRWLLWLAGAALALGGVFLARHLLVAGLLPPAGRVAFGLVLGMALAAAGEWFRRHASPRDDTPDYIPPALSAGGLAVAFASLYAGHGLYGLFPPVWTFILLAAVALAAMALSLVQGPALAALGLVAAYAIPVLIPSENPTLWGLVPFLLAVTAAGIILVRMTSRVWLVWLTLGCAVAWGFVIALEISAFSEPLPAFLYPTALLALVVGLLRPDRDAEEKEIFLLDFTRVSLRDQAILMTACAGVPLVLALQRADDPALAGTLALLPLFALQFLLAWNRPRWDLSAAAASIVAVFGLLIWRLTPEASVSPLVMSSLDVPSFLSLDARLHAATGATLALVLGIGGFLLVRRGRRPAYWAALSAALPFVLYSVVRWRSPHLLPDPAWSGVSLALAGAALGAAAWALRHRSRNGMVTVLGIYAVAVAAGIALGLTLLLENAWLTVALALLLPVLAWLRDRLDIPLLGYAAWAALLLVSLRLSAHWVPIGLPFGLLPGVPDGALANLWEFGVPAATMAVSAFLFRRRADNTLVAALEGGALAFSTVLATLEIRELVWALDPLHLSRPHLEGALRGAVWLALAIGLYWREGVPGHSIRMWGWRLLAAMAAVQVILLNGIVFNPMITGHSVGELPVVNLLLLTFAVPAALLFLWRHLALVRNNPGIALWNAGIGLVLIFADATLETRHAFHGPVLAGGQVSNAELYSYSAVWLLLAAGLLVLGIARRLPVLRRVSLGLILLCVAKVFLVDMGGLEGLWRVASLAGLGVSLIAVALVYRRFVSGEAEGAT